MSTGERDAEVENELDHHADVYRYLNPHRLAGTDHLRRYPVTGLDLGPAETYQLTPSQMIHPEVERWRGEQLLETAIARREELRHLIVMLGWAAVAFLALTLIGGAVIAIATR